ncbi:MAG: archease [Alphaproteobacteria bacterium]
MAAGRWEHFPHQADMGIRGVGPTEADAFAQAALAMTALITEPDAVRPAEAVAIACQAADPDDLFYDWLNALVLEMATRRMLFSRFDVVIKGDRLEAKAWGEPIIVSRHKPAVEVKGATYTALRVGRSDRGEWIAECVVDV